MSFLKKENITRKIIEDEYKNILFPIMFYDVENKYPEYKFLSNRIFNFYVYDNLNEFLEHCEEMNFIKSFVRMIDSNGVEYYVLYSKNIETMIPKEKLRSLNLSEIKDIITPFLLKLHIDKYEDLLKIENISNLFKNIQESNED